MALINTGAQITVTLGIPLNLKGTTYNLRGIIEHDTEDQQRTSRYPWVLLSCLNTSWHSTHCPKIAHSGHGFSDSVSNKLKLSIWHL